MNKFIMFVLLSFVCACETGNENADKAIANAKDFTEAQTFVQGIRWPYRSLEEQGSTVVLNDAFEISDPLNVFESGELSFPKTGLYNIVLSSSWDKELAEPTILVTVTDNSGQTNGIGVFLNDDELSQQGVIMPFVSGDSATFDVLCNDACSLYSLSLLVSEIDIAAAFDLLE